MVNLQKQNFKAEYGAIIYALSILILLCVQMLGFFLLKLFKGSGAYGAAANAVGILFQAGNAAVFYYFLKRHNSVPDIFIKSKTRPVFVLAGAACGIISLFAFLPVAMFGNKLLEVIGYIDVSEQYFSTPAQIIFAFVSAGILAPIFEELIYRSALLSSLQRSFSNKIVVSILCGALFAFMHMNPLQTLYQFCLGSVCSYAALTTGSVLPAIAAHFVSNITVLVSLSYKDFLQAYADFLQGNVILWLIIGILSFVAGSVLVFFMFRLLSNRQNQEDAFDTHLQQNAEANNKNAEKSNFLENRKKIFRPLLLGFAICLFIWAIIMVGSLTAKQEDLDLQANTVFSILNINK